MDTVKGFDFVNIGCMPRCIHFKGNKTETIESISTYKGTTRAILRVDTIPECGKDAERAIIRQEIYDRALATRDSMPTIRRGHNAFERIANEWRNHKCKFFEPI